MSGTDQHRRPPVAGEGWRQQRSRQTAPWQTGRLGDGECEGAVSDFRVQVCHFCVWGRAFQAEEGAADAGVRKQHVGDTGVADGAE